MSLPVRLEQLLAAFRSLAASPRDLAIVSGWALAGAAAKVGAATAVVAAIGIDNPLRAALVLVPAVELAAILPDHAGKRRARERRRRTRARLSGGRFEDGAVGGNRLRSRRAPHRDGVGAAGALALAGPWVRPYLRVAAVGAAASLVAIAFGATVLLPAV